MICLGQVEAEQVQHPHDKVEYPRNPKVQCEGCDKVASQVGNICHFCGGNSQVIINKTVKDQVRDAPKHPLHASLVNLKLLSVVVGPAERPVVHNWEERENNVWKQKEIRERGRNTHRAFVVPEIVHIENQPE